MYVDINYRGEKITVEGVFTERVESTYTDPGEDADFEIEYIWYEDVNVLPFIEDQYEVKQLVLEVI